MTGEELKALLEPLINAGREIQAGVGGPDRDYYNAAVDEAERLLNKTVQQIMREMK